MLDLKYSEGQYPPGLKVGDFIQTSSHFGDVFFEVVKCMPPREDSRFWMVTYVTYDKYGSQPRTSSVNSAGSIRAVISAEMAIPVMLKRRLRFKSMQGQYDPIFGFAPVGTPLRKKETY